MKSRRSRVKAEIGASIEVKCGFLARESGVLEAICGVVVRCLRRQGRLFLCGNGGSAADAQHIAAELEGRYRVNRAALPVLALTTNSSTLTAVGNDYGYEQIFSRQIEAHVRRGDVVILISTSGNSPNILRAAAAVRARRAIGIGFTGDSGGALKDVVDHCLRVPAERVSNIQECHILAGHILCGVVEEEVFGAPRKRRSAERPAGQGRRAR